MSALRIVGMDLSLTSTGLSDGQTVRAVQTTDEWCVEDRLIHIAYECVSFVFQKIPGVETRHNRADLVVIEGAAYGSKGNAVDQLAGLRWAVRMELRRTKVPFVIVPPSTLKAYTTGNGRASKPQMVAALEERHGLILRGYRIKDGKYDMADAYALAAMGYAAMGQPLPTQGPVPSVPTLKTPWPQLV